jgi:hypothetical protein
VFACVGINESENWKVGEGDDFDLEEDIFQTGAEAGTKSGAVIGKLSVTGLLCGSTSVI